MFDDKIIALVNPQTWTSLTAKQPHAQSLSASVIHVITWITTHLPTPKGWKAELAWLVDP